VEEVGRAVVVSESRPDVPALVVDLIGPDGDDPGETIYR